MINSRLYIAKIAENVIKLPVIFFADEIMIFVAA